MSQSLQIQYVLGGAATYLPGASFGPRRLNDYEAVWIVDGDVAYFVDDDRYAVGPGTLILARPGFNDRFVWDTVKPTRHLYFHFTPMSVPDDWPPTNDWPIVRMMPDGDILRPLFRYIVGHCLDEQVTPNLTRAVEMYLGAYLLGPMGQVNEYEQTYPEPVFKTLQYIQSHIQSANEAPEVMVLADLANAAAVSPEHLCRLFRQTFGMSPMQVARLMRLDQAVTLIARSNFSLKQIAHRCGFASPFHFSKCFRHTYGRSPSDVRKSIQAGEFPPMSPLHRAANP